MDWPIRLEMGVVAMAVKIFESFQGNVHTVQLCLMYTNSL